MRRDAILSLLVAILLLTTLLAVLPAFVGAHEEVEGEAKLDDPGNNAFSPTGVTAKIEFKDDGTTLKMTGKAKGLTPGVPYASLIYDIFSSDEGPFACEPFFAPDDPSPLNIFATMFVGLWDVDEDGKGKLSATNIGPTFGPGSPVYVPLSKIGTISIRDLTVIGDFGPGTGPAAVVACGVVEVEDDEEKDDKREVESDMNDRFATETGAEGSVEWKGITGGVRISELEAEGLTPGHSYEIIVLIDFDPSLVFTFGPFVADDDGELEVEDLEFTGLASGDHRADVFVTHIHSTVAGTGPTGLLITDLIGRDPLLACQPALFFTA